MSLETSQKNKQLAMTKKSTFLKVSAAVGIFGLKLTVVPLNNSKYF